MDKNHAEKDSMKTQIMVIEKGGLQKIDMIHIIMKRIIIALSYKLALFPLYLFGFFGLSISRSSNSKNMSPTLPSFFTSCSDHEKYPSPDFCWLLFSILLLKYKIYVLYYNILFKKMQISCILNYYFYK